MNNLLNRMGGADQPWFVENHPENKHINYLRNPIHGVKELGGVIRAMQGALPFLKPPPSWSKPTKTPPCTPQADRRSTNSSAPNARNCALSQASGTAS